MVVVINVHVGYYRNGLPHPASTQALQSVWTMLKNAKTASYTLADNLQIAFSINTSTDDISIHPERFCICCKHSMQRTIHALTEGYITGVLQSQKHNNEECKVHIHDKELLACMTS